MLMALVRGQALPAPLHLTYHYYTLSNTNVKHQYVLLDTDNAIIYTNDMAKVTHNKGADMPERFYSAEEIAEYLHIGAQTVRAWLRDGKVKAVKFGRSWRISDEELKRIVAEGVPEDD